MPRRKSRENPALFESNPLPQFASTPEQIRRAVQRNAVQRGQFYALNLARLGFDDILDQVDRIAAMVDPEVWREAASRWGIEIDALDLLDTLPLRYPFYFCEPTFFERDPALVLYYRNVAMTSAKVMRGIGLETDSHEHGDIPSFEKALQLAIFFNSTVSKLLVENSQLITPRRHLEMALTNVGESLGGSWRNEIGRLSYTELMRMLLTFLHSRGWLHEVMYDLKGPLGTFSEEEEEVVTARDVVTKADLSFFKQFADD